MEETIKIQEEFENLIEQLERLKNINELTSSNAESAKKVIEYIDSFIKSTNAFMERIESEYTTKSEFIEILISTLDKLLLKIDTKTEELSNSVSNSLSEHKGEIKESLNAIVIEVKDAFRIFNESFANKSNEIKINFENYSNSVLDQNTKYKTEVFENLALFKTSVDNSYQEIIKLINGNQAISIQRLDRQEKKIKLLKTILFVICGLIIIGTVVSIVL